MALVTKSIGTSSRDYSTITSWESDLDDGAVYSSGDDALGECYNDADFVESPSITGGDTIGLSSVKLSVASGERHDGTINSGASIVGILTVSCPSGLNDAYTVEWLELDADNDEVIIGTGSDFTNVPTVQNVIGHNGSAIEIVDAASRDMRIQNSIFYDFERNGSFFRGITLDGDRSEGGFLNNTCYGFSNSVGDIDAIKINTNDSDSRVKNNISVGHSATGTANDFDFPGTNPDSLNNLSEDATADDAGGTGHLINESVTGLFVSTTAGSEDLHLTSGSNAIDAGVDLGTTPADIEIDIDGRDRDSNGDTWDIGAHEFVSAGGGGNAYASRLTLLGVG